MRPFLEALLVFFPVCIRKMGANLSKYSVACGGRETVLDKQRADTAAVALAAAAAAKNNALQEQQATSQTPSQPVTSESAQAQLDAPYHSGGVMDRLLILIII